MQQLFLVAKLVNSKFPRISSRSRTIVCKSRIFRILKTPKFDVSYLGTPAILNFVPTNTFVSAFVMFSFPWLPRFSDIVASRRFEKESVIAFNPIRMINGIFRPFIK